MTERFDVYQHVTDTIIRQLEAGVPPWRQNWASTGGAFAMPLRSTGEAYRGVNILLLWGAQAEGGYTQRRWMTFKQAVEAGAGVRKGERGSKVVYANKITREVEGDNGTEEVKIPYMKAYTVFNIEQIDGLSPDYFEATTLPDPATAPQRIEAAERFLDAVGADIRHGGDKASYMPAVDAIRLPPLELFTVAEHYYSVRAHETVHWTGHESRLARTFGARFGDEAYAREELVAELGAAFLCAQLGLASEPRDDHASYLDHWLKALKEDKRAIFNAASHAQKACDYLRNLASPVAADEDQVEAQAA